MDGFSKRLNNSSWQHLHQFLLCLSTTANLFSIQTLLTLRSGQSYPKDKEGVRQVAYASWRLNQKYIKYCVTRNDLLATVYFMRYFRQCLLGREFKISTDHSALTWLRYTHDPIGQQAKNSGIIQISYWAPPRNKTWERAISRRYCKTRDCARNLTATIDKAKRKTLQDGCHYSVMKTKPLSENLVSQIDQDSSRGVSAIHRCVWITTPILCLVLCQ